MVLTLYDYGQLQFNCGNYGGAADMLYHFRVLVCVYDVFISIRYISNQFR